eukprot:4674819-Pyramimonas_sp.AAC.1
MSGWLTHEEVWRGIACEVCSRAAVGRAPLSIIHSQASPTACAMDMGCAVSGRTCARAARLRSFATTRGMGDRKVATARNI